MNKDYLSDERREFRKQRRLRNQRMAYLSVFLIIAVVITAVIFGVVSGKTPQQGGNRDPNMQAGATGVVNEDSTTGGNSIGAENPSAEDIFASEEVITPPPAVTAAPEPTMSPEEILEQKITETIDSMSLTEKVAGLFIVTPEAITGVDTAVQAGEGTKEALEEYPVGGVIYFAKNMQSKEQLTQMISNTKEYSKFPLFIAVDEEGGTVNRVAGAGFAEKQPSASEIGATGDANNAYVAGSNIGAYLSEIGFNVDFAPVADLSNVEGSVMTSRAYGADAATVGPFVASMVTGLQEKGVTACLKHFPGIGSTTADTHNGLAYTERTVEEFQQEEFQVFKAGIEAGAGMIMVGHVSAEGLAGDNTPASMSEVIITDYLRGELGYQGVIITDALNMSAISSYYSSGQAAVMALKAGCDMVLMPENFLQAYAGVLNAISEGTISEERVNDSLRRIYRIKYAE